jgi:hypothetical protein
MTGDVISVEKESAESESKEATGGKDKDQTHRLYRTFEEVRAL